MLNKELRMSSNTIVSNCCEAEFETVDLEMEVCGSCYQVADQYDPIEDEPSYLIHSRLQDLERTHTGQHQIVSVLTVRMRIPHYSEIS